jgi:hypothetical protein
MWLEARKRAPKKMQRDFDTVTIFGALEDLKGAQQTPLAAMSTR